ncbi:noggin-like [Myzus persicae]|uniref:noggin-like n=1 Tax=Myzus persicae TaxID=13164 RepID=UPI000B93337E|nr:noggin-like [Myzus persicae]XP_022162707.1 noggin-like [Myzus persicae]
MRRPFDIGVALLVVLLAVGQQLQNSVAINSPAKKTSGGSFSVWFRAEPGLPRKKDMKVDKLNRLIGADYNEMWMSKTAIVITADRRNASGVAGVKSFETTGPDNLQLPEQLPAQYQEMMRTWLVHRSSCPVEYGWVDLGKSFWPRWIKQGRCGRSETMSCSWPPGMSCMPSSIRVLNLLRWHCWLKNRKNKKKNRERLELAFNKTRGHGARGRRAVGQRKSKKKDDKFRCLWIKVPYPVTEDCTCSCRKLDE